jgi:hypothetical protein
MPRLLCTLLLLAAVSALPVQAQHHGRSSTHHPEPHHRGGSTAMGGVPLHAPGHAIFGTVQEAIRALEADSTTDWSQVDVEALRQHLIDMHHVALHVAVEERTPIEGGVRLVVRPTNDAAAAALQRVLSAHPAMLQQETGWQMDVNAEGDRFALRITDPSGGAVNKIRALGYMGVLAYGAHHQHHHWMMVRGHAPHGHHH